MKRDVPLSDKNGGFSLVEVIIVIAIIAALTAVLVPVYIRYVAESKRSICEVNRTEIERLFLADYSDDYPDAAEALKNSLAAEHADYICPLGGVNADSFSIENDVLSITCSVHVESDGADAADPAAFWAGRALGISEVEENIDRFKRYNYVRGQVYYANNAYFVFTGRNGNIQFKDIDTAGTFDQQLYDDLNFRATSGSAVRVNMDAATIVYNRTDDKLRVMQGDLTWGKDDKLYIWKGTSGINTKGPDSYENPAESSNWVEVLTG